MAGAWDVVVVGAGMTGTLVAERLQRRGARVLLLDAGPRLEVGEKVPEPDRRVWPFKAVGGSYDWYRVRAVGGRSLLWGGWCFRFDEAALQRAAWPVTARQLEPAYRAAERRLGVTTGTVDERYRRAAAECGVRVLPKRGAHVAPGVAWSTVGSEAARRARPHCVALHLEVTARRAVAVTVHDLATEKVRHLRARNVVLAASPFETARILLRTPWPRAPSGIGRGWTDHMVASFVLLEPRPPPTPTTPRDPLAGAALVPNFVNLGDDSARPYPGGFSLELSGPVHLETLGLERMVAQADVGQWRATQVHAMGELFPHPDRVMDLHPELRDVLGRPLPRISVAWSDADRVMADDMKKACASFADAMAVPGSRLVPFVDPLLAGAGHEASTCRMGAGDEPADARGKLRALDNVWIADASVMPTAGDRHPTLTLLAHAVRVSNAVARALR